MSSKNHNSLDAPTITTTRTILRIKRRRNENPLPYLRLEGLDGSIKRKRSNTSNHDAEDQQLSDLMQQNARLQPNVQPITTHTSIKTTKSTTTTAIWKRMRPNDEQQQTQKEAHYRVVDAVLEEDAAPTIKRRKLTVLETSSQTQLLPEPSIHKQKKKKGLKVLDPLTRLVDDSLQEVHQGTKTARQHFRFVQTDTRLAHASCKHLKWCHSAGGNLLHACAMWNDVELASELVQMDLSLTEAVDGDNKTPYELAQLAGHESICQVLEAFGGDVDNYVYDIFYLEDTNNSNNENTAAATNAVEEEGKTSMYQENPIFTAELTSGVGYWTPFGELVLEAPEKHQASLDHIFDEDGEIDSNCEEYGANDYPDEHETDHDDDDSWAEGFTPDQGFRHYEMGGDGHYAYDAAHDYDGM